MRATLLVLAVLTLGVLGLASDGSATWPSAPSAVPATSDPSCYWRWECLRWEGRWYVDQGCLLACTISCGGICSGAAYEFCEKVGPAGWFSGISCAVILGGGCSAACYFLCELFCTYWTESCVEWQLVQICGGGEFPPWPPIYIDSMAAGTSIAR